MELVHNVSGKGRFELGYTIVCNRSQSDLGITFEERNKNEVAFFNLETWKSLPNERVGMKALKHRLDNLLVDITRRSFTGVAVDIKRKIEDVNNKIELMGPVRETTQDQRIHLITIASKFRDISTKAIDAYYSRDQCFEDDDSLRLATIIMELNNEFSQTIETKGFTRAFHKGPSAAGHSPETYAVTPPPPDVDTDSLCSAETPNEEIDQYPELRNIIESAEKSPETAQGNIMTWITHKYNRSKGFEIGTINPSLMPSLFAEQSQSWAFYSHSHVTKVIQRIHGFSYKVLQHCCNDNMLCARLWKKLVQSFLNSYKQALAQVTFLVEVERRGNLITMNHYLAENIRKSREELFKQRLEDLQSWSTPGSSSKLVESEPLLRLHDVLNVMASNDEHTTQDLHDTLKSYYKVARKRFVDAVCLQAIDHFLVSGKNGPLWIFSAQFVGAMSDAELGLIAGDEEETVKRRNLLQAELESLKAGAKISES